ncbi:MAG TPA: Fur family transcriptional regulator [Prolixibacteraceae bacterium]|nr:Fur family transcriptional regulator [Prolixibacteraceae bacterium]HPS11969.1 Fur family transcriptional regulator [Prolixibacteraceae bacterium]
MEKISEFLTQHGIKPSIQREKIYEYLFMNRIHPTADNIHMALSPSIPSLSKTTVYNTVKLFVEKRIAIVVNIEDNEVRYDADISLHGHFKCKGCGGVFDFRVGKNLEIDGLDQFRIDEYHLYLKGYCKICKPS